MVGGACPAAAAAAIAAAVAAVAAVAASAGRRRTPPRLRPRGEARLRGARGLERTRRPRGRASPPPLARRWPPPRSGRGLRAASAPLRRLRRLRLRRGAAGARRRASVCDRAGARAVPAPPRGTARPRWPRAGTAGRSVAAATRAPNAALLLGAAARRRLLGEVFEPSLRRLRLRRRRRGAAPSSADAGAFAARLILQLGDARLGRGLRRLRRRRLAGDALDKLLQRGSPSAPAPGAPCWPWRRRSPAAALARRLAHRGRRLGNTFCCAASGCRAVEVRAAAAAAAAAAAPPTPRRPRRVTHGGGLLHAPDIRRRRGAHGRRRRRHGPKELKSLCRGVRASAGAG